MNNGASIRSVVGAVTVSTVAISRGVYETAVIVGGNVSDAVRTDKGIASARVGHDVVCDCVRGYGERGSITAERVSRALADVRGAA